MKITLNLSQHQSLQLSTSIALEQGVEQVHDLVKDHEERLADPAFIREMQQLILQANRKGNFSKGLPGSYFLKDEKHLLEGVIRYAALRHNGEYRESGYPILAHVLSAGFVLARLGFPKEIILSGILHDTVEDTPHKIKTLNELYAMKPQLAYYVFSVSGPDTQDSVAKDMVLNARIHSFSDHAHNLFPQAIKCADGIANLYDLHCMQAKDGRSAAERQHFFLQKLRDHVLPFAVLIDEAKEIPIEKRKEVFSLHEFLHQAIEQKSQEIA